MLPADHSDQDQIEVSLAVGRVAQHRSRTYEVLDPCVGHDSTCCDSIENGDETGVDCGGSCDPCPAT